MAVLVEKQFTSWGRIEHPRHFIASPRFRNELPRIVALRGERSLLAVGLGRSYGDTILNTEGCLIETTGLDRVISFDREAGILRAEAGLSIHDALRLLVPAGWFLTTTPGTRFVTLGGAVANDVHGKNHHTAGSFGCSVRRLGLLRSDGSEVELARSDASNLFCSTIGGLGLTGIITWVEIDLVRIPSAYLDVERFVFDNISSFFDLASRAQSFEHTVAWFDCANSGSKLGRGIFQGANWSRSGGLAPHTPRQKLTMPIDAPSWALNGLAVRSFNALYHQLQKRPPLKTTQHYAAVFHPLDAIGGWNRLYGRRGFYQYQCVIPPSSAENAVTDLVRHIARAGTGSFLAVLKTFGSRASPGLLSFPREGATLALDFPNRGPETLDLLARLDEIVLEAGGRLYPAKDGRMSARMFQAGYGSVLPAFQTCLDPALSSQFWRRVST